ncbi:MAG: hypothetical protein LZF60_280042 [Nitrospira sp.]|nr:PqqD family protein [Nitrospira sp.]ULA61006.1 MAG: hypothetical protein LZF60_280042 [Nitrospira sp.]
MPATVPLVSERTIELSQMFPQQNSEVQITVQGGESVLLNQRTGQFHRLSVLGSVVWPQCTGTRSVERILSTISETFDVTAARAQSDLLDVLVQLQQDGLLHIEKR